VYWRKGMDKVQTIPALACPVPMISSKRRPFWSVIVPVYERRQYLKQCLESVLDQDPGPDEMEILVIDDASSTDLRGFVEELTDGRASYLRNATNLGLYPSTNLALRQARGTWLHILHDDDWVLPGFYATMRRDIEAAPAEVGVAFCMYANWHEREMTTWSPPGFRDQAGVMGRDFLVRLAAANPLNLPAVTYRRETFEKVGLFREDLSFTADWEWYVRSAVQVAWHHQPETLAVWRVHEANQTHELARAGIAARDIRRTYELFAQYLPKDIAALALPAGREFHARQFLGTGLAHAQTGNLGLVDRLVLEALAMDPDGPARPEFAPLLQHPHFTSLRNEVREALLRRL
jgi:protein O-GlcNAc transferase